MPSPTKIPMLTYNQSPSPVSTVPGGVVGLGVAVGVGVAVGSSLGVGVATVSTLHPHKAAADRPKTNTRHTIDLPRIDGSFQITMPNEYRSKL